MPPGAVNKSKAGLRRGWRSLTGVLVHPGRLRVLETYEVTTEDAALEGLELGRADLAPR